MIRLRWREQETRWQAAFDGRHGYRPVRIAMHTLEGRLWKEITAHCNAPGGA